jgi:dTMP kinase
MLITVEGIEGVGKTTQVATLQSCLETLGYSVCLTREPGGTWYAERVRELLLMTPPQGVTESLHSDTELLLMFASRVQHYHTLIEPALRAGNAVICSRFIDSSLAYQGGGRGVPLERIQALAEWSLPGVTPDLTFLLDMPAHEGLARAQQRAELDRIEQEQLSFFDRVRETYLRLAAREPGRFVIIDARASREQVADQIQTACLSRVASLSAALSDEYA